jgi:hypothetical protein
MFNIVKIFTIKDQSEAPSDTTEFLIKFYQTLLDEGHIVSSIVADQFIPTLVEIKSPFLQSNKFTSQSISELSDTSVIWQAEFDSTESYEEYKNSVNEIFGTNFHMEIDSPTIKLEIIT